MTINIGVDFTPGQWRVCTLEQGRPAQFRVFAVARELLEVVSQLCALYPEPTIVLSLDISTPLSALHTLSEKRLELLAQRYHPHQVFTEVWEVLQALRELNMRSYCAPSVEYLPTIPFYRLLMRPALGAANELCAVVALLHHMREQEASWPEMNFFYVNVGEQATCVLVLKDGQVVNGIGMLQGSSLPANQSYLALTEPGKKRSQEEIQQTLSEAFWEGLTQDLAGLMATHHFEDIVVLGRENASVAERLANLYQVYLFPHAQTESVGYESAFGAALLADGLDSDGLASEVIERLQVRQATGFEPALDL